MKVVNRGYSMRMLSGLFVASALMLTFGAIEKAVAQEGAQVVSSEGTSVAPLSFDRSEPAIFKVLAGLALDSLKKGDQARAITIARVVERFWDSSQTTDVMAATMHDKYRGIDVAMDRFIAALEKPVGDTATANNVELTYRDYVEALNGVHWLSQVLSSTIEARGIEAAVSQYESLKKQGFPNILSSEADTDTLGSDLLSKGKKREAIEIFRLNVAAYPKSANVYDSLAEAYEANAQKNLASENHIKSRSIKVDTKRFIDALQKLDGQRPE
jgi:hypothetical protein